MNDVYLIFTPTGISGGRRLSDVGDLQAGDDAPLLFPEVGPKTYSPKNIKEKN